MVLANECGGPPDRGHPVRQRAQPASALTRRVVVGVFALRAQADKMSAIRPRFWEMNRFELDCMPDVISPMGK